MVGILTTTSFYLLNMLYMVSLLIVINWLLFGWIRALRQVYCSPSMKHGLDIQDGSQADRYVAKWGLPEEMSKGHMKKGKNGGYTLSICWSYLLKISPYTVVNCLLNYFQEYAIVMKGQRQLVWGRGLKTL